MEARKQNKNYYWVYDVNRALIGVVSKEREKTLSREEYIRVVSCFVINENNEVLIEKRLDEGLNPGELDLCSGHIDKNEFANQAIRRELNEELGIDKEKMGNLKKVIDYEYPISITSGDNIRNFFTNFYCLKVKKEDVSFNKEEVKSIAWLPMQKAFELIKRGETRFPKNFDYKQIFKIVEEFSKQKEKDSKEDQEKY